MSNFSKLSSTKNDAPHQYLSPGQAEHKHLFLLERTRWFKQVYWSKCIPNKEDASNKATLQICRHQCVAQALCTKWQAGSRHPINVSAFKQGIKQSLRFRFVSAEPCQRKMLRYIPEKKKRWLKISCCSAHLSADSIKRSFRLPSLASPKVAISTPCIATLWGIRVQHALYYSLHFYVAVVWFTSHAVTIKLSICSLQACVN